MTWNIWHGGKHGTKESGFKEDEKNSVNTLKVIQEERPDILFMQETYCCGMQTAKDAGYKHSVRGSSNLSIHSNYPILEHIKLFRAFNSHGAIIDVDGTKVLCFNIWLHYLPDFFNDIKTKTPKELIAGEAKTRFAEIKQILIEVDSIAKLYPNYPIIIGGDFNSGSHLDWVEATKEHHYNKVVKWPVSNHMIENGFEDSFREVNLDLESTLQGTWGFLSGNIISDRIDYIYHKGGLKTLKSKIVMDDPKGGFFNSDHRAIKTIFNIKK
jgi:exonuclease III